MGHRTEAEAPDGDQALDSLLAQWTEKQCLSEIRSEAIRQRLMQTVQVVPTELPYSWWRRLFEQCTMGIPASSLDFWSRICFMPANARAQM